MDVCLNGEMLPHHKAAVSVDDAGFQHAVGLFETMSVRNGRTFRGEKHLARLCASAAALGLTREVEVNDLRQAVHKTITHNMLEHGRIRLTYTPGPISLLLPENRRNKQKPRRTILVSAASATEYDPLFFEKGITVLLIPSAANPFDPTAGHKTLSYWSRLRTLRHAAAVEAGEAIWLYTSNHLASGAVSNIFLIKDDRLLTPIARGEEEKGAIPSPVLPGITREAVIELATSLGLTVEKRMLAVDDLLKADEVFLTNSGWHLLPVTRAEKHEIADGKVGFLTTRLRSGLLEMIEKETLAPRNDSPVQEAQTADPPTPPPGS